MIDTTTQTDDFGFSKDILCLYLKNGLKFLYQGYQIVLSKTEYILSRDSPNLENLIRDDIEREAKEIHKLVFSKDRANQYLKFKFFNESRDATDKTDIKRFDILLNYDTAYENPEMIIECKRLKKNTKNAAYIENGIERFETNRYGYGLPIAGMIGFIEEGNETDIIEDLTKRIDKKTTIEQSLNILDVNSSVHSDLYKEHIYNSIHQRTDDLNSIEIFHLMMDFTSIIKP